jgi:hypothetical protein
MEMSEERIAERIDANLLNIPITELKTVERPVFETRIQRLMEKTTGKLIIKEYPTSSAHAGHFRVLLEELKGKKNFKPDLICIDYLNICASQRMKYGSGVNSYMLIKSIAEELRGLAVEYNVPVVTATQPNRCLSLDTIVKHEDKGDIEIKDLIVGDKILSRSKYVTVKKVFPIEEKKVYEITTENGKVIRCSGSHLFPTANGVKSIESGLAISDELFTIG